MKTSRNALRSRVESLERDLEQRSRELESWRRAFRIAMAAVAVLFLAQAVEYFGRLFLR